MGKGGKKKWEFVGGGHCTSAKSEYLKGKWCSQLGTQKLWRCCSQLLQPWHLQLEEKPSQMMSVRRPALTADGGALSKTQCRPISELGFWCLASQMPFLGCGVPRQWGWSSPIALRDPKAAWGLPAAPGWGCLRSQLTTLQQKNPWAVLQALNNGSRAAREGWGGTGTDKAVCMQDRICYVTLYLLFSIPLHPPIN